MRWRLWLGAGVAVVLTVVLGFGALLAWVFGPLVPLEDGRQVGPLLTVVDGYVATFIGETRDGTLFLVDAGDDAEAAALFAALARKGKGPDDVAAIFITHGHQDHVRGCGRFPRAEVVAISAEAPLIVGERRSEGLLPSWTITDGSCQVSRGVGDGETVHLGGSTIQAIAMPGHTEGSAAWLIDGETLALGDAASITRSGDVIPAPSWFSDHPDEAAETLAGLADRVPDTVRWLVPAHSGPWEGLEGLKP